MSSQDKSDRRILRAKRHEGSSLGRNVSFPTAFDTNNGHRVPQKGIKRSSDREVDDYPPRKKINTSNYRLKPSTFSNSLMTKNFANDRLNKLRRDLDELRKQEERRNSQGEVSDANVATSTPQIARQLPLFLANAASPVRKQERTNIQEEVLDSKVLTSTPQFSRQLPFFLANAASPLTKQEERTNSKREVLYSNVATSTHQISRQLPLIPANSASSIQNRLQICNNISNLTELMDWGPIDEETVFTNINEIRREISYENKMPMDDLFIPNQEEIPAVNNGIFVVVDTNIFLSKLDFLARLRSSQFSDLGQISIIVPWMVIQELDYMKDNSGHKNLGKNSRKAIQYINNQLIKKDMYFKGQSVLDASKQIVGSNNPDDGILHCCMQLVDEHKYVILLSNDTNLRNKALVHNISASHSDNLLDDLKQLKAVIKPEFNHKSIQKVKILLSNLLTKIIEKEMMEAYGQVWLKMVKTPPPYTPEEGLHIMQKYWKAVFSFSLQKQALLGIETFISFFRLHNKDERYNMDDFNKLIENSLSLCIYLKNGYKHHTSFVMDCIKRIQICAE